MSVLLAALTALAGLGATAAQEPDGELTAVCIQGFETAPYVAYLTDEEIAEIEATVDDGTDIPPPKIVGYPDPETGSCATEGGALMDYNPEVYTPVCVPSGPEGDGPLVVQWALTHYLTPDSGVILADPETGACPNDDPDSGDATDGGDTGEDAVEDDAEETTTLPSTGTGTGAAEASHPGAAASLMIAAMALAGAGGVLRRWSAGRR